MTPFFRQMYWLLYRNVTVKIRMKQLTFQEIFIPLIFVANLATIRFTTRTEPLPAVTTDQIPSQDLFDGSFVPSYLLSSPIAFTPDVAAVESVVSELAVMLNVTKFPSVVGYETEGDIVDAVVNGTANISLALVFEDDYPLNLTYKIRLGYGGTTLDYNSFLGGDNCYAVDKLNSYNCPAASYLFSGFSAVQAMVEHIMVKAVSGNSSLTLPDILVRLFLKGQFSFSQDSLRIVSSIYIVLAYMPFPTSLLAVLVYEKEQKVKEVMKIMGLNNAAFWLSWMVVYSLILGVLALIITGYCKLITIFPAGNFFIIFLGLLFFGLAVVTSAFMLSPLFQKATSAGAGGSLFTMLFLVPYIPFGVLGVDIVSPAILWILCLFAPTAVALFIDRAILFEELYGGLQFSNLTLGAFPPYAPLVMLIVDVILYLLLAIYLENVVPGAYGTTMSPFFCLKPSFWFGSKSKEADDRTGLLGNEENGIEDHTDIEPIPAALRGRNGIRLRNIRKTFPGKDGQPEVKAVNGVSLDIYEGQITCLLGHNGAGKSTLINCLSGMTRVTSGQATLYGLDVSDAMDLGRLRSMTGVCLQENALIEVLTPEEHLRFYAGLTGVPEEEFEQRVEETLQQIDLGSQRTTLAKDLSGGQKRKLCVGIAIIGNPKILFLDEPSSGMDPYSRRKMWSFLKKQREGRVTLLTTHFMDEADILADRKAIMSKGQLRCCGSSLFLKNKFGVGYHLGLVKDGNCDEDKVTSLIQTHIPEAKVSRSHGMELSYSLPLKDVSAFAGMFKNLEEASAANGNQTNAQEIGILSYGVSMTTLEEVFLKIGEEAEMDEIDGAVPASAISGMNVDDGNNVAINLEASPLDSTILATKPIVPTRKEKIKCLAHAEAIYAIRNPGTYICRIAFPIILMVAGGVMALVLDFGGSSSVDSPAPLEFDPSMYFDSVGMTGESTDTSLLYKDSLPSGQAISAMLAQFDRLDIASNATTNLSALYEERPHNGAVDLLDLGTSTLTSEYTAYYNDTALHSLPVMVNVLSNALLGLFSGDPDAPVIRAVSHPFPKPPETPTYVFNTGILFVYIFGIGVCMMLVGYPVDRVMERQQKIKAQLRIAGIDTLIYWTSVFIVDIVQMLVITVIGLIIVFAMQVPSLITGGAIFCIFWMLLAYVPSAIMHSYCIGFLFDRFETAQSYVYFFFMHIPMILILPTTMIDLLVSPVIAGAVSLVFVVLYPVYGIFGALYFIDRVYQSKLILGQADTITFGDYFEPSAFVWPTILLIMINNITMVFFLRFCEITKTGGNKKDTCPCLADQKIGMVESNTDVIGDEDSDVKAERVKVEEIFTSDAPSAVAMSELRKEFVKRSDKTCGGGQKVDTTKVAVRNLSLKVQTGEVLGLLGPNGAGKTTTMNMVTADFDPTRGQIRVGGHDVTSALSSAYNSMGYCPQIDPLWETITMREHLCFFAGFKGIHPDDRGQIAEHYMTALGVMEHADKQAKELSGGTKRKLCFALSMLGNPQIVLLDEPSTGMDPGSKRFLWNVITSSFLERKGAILTTHSMEEADAVCSRVGIMISGELKCLGTTQHLKDKYGGGYIMEIKLNPGVSYYTAADQTSSTVADALDAKVEVLHGKVLELIPQAEVIESFAERISYKIPRGCEITLSTVFAFLEEGKQQYGIEEYSFSQTTLEQVFIEFAKSQADDELAAADNEAFQVEAGDPHRPSSRRSVRSGPRPQEPVNPQAC